MSSRNEELSRLIDSALAVVVSQESNSEQESKNLAALRDALEGLLRRVSRDQLEPSHGVVTLGLSRMVADWVDSLESPLLKAVGLIENYYQKHF
jgi:hypothetical protein